jgi:DNA-binding response OmpR family regulator
MRILLLEDHAALRELLAAHLTQNGFAVDAVARGDEAIAAAAAAPYEAIVLDLGLPDIDGLEVLAAVRARMNRQLPALIVTARDGIDDRVRGLNAGADDYIVKPFDLLELEARLRAVLRRPGARSETSLTCGQLVFDAATRSASVGSQALDLSRREAALLEELLRANGRVVVKDALEDRLYAFDDAVTTNALEASVSRLRKKLAAAKAAVRIDTKRGIGYRLVPGEDV